MIEIFFFSFATAIYYFSAGIFFTSKILNQNTNKEINIYKFILYGAILLAFISLIFNFFFSLSKNLNTCIFLFFLFYLLLNHKNKIKKIISSSIIIGFACSILLIFENTYRPDSGLYHLPYISTLNNEKIIIGLSNIHFRFGHTSIMQYLSALNNNWIFYDHGILIPSAIIYIGFLIYLIFELKNTNDKNILLFNFLLFAFLCLKLNRYSDFGNDAPAHIYYFFLTSLALNYYKNLDKAQISEVLILSAYIFYNKITLFLGGLITIIFLFFKKKIYYFHIKPLIFVILFTSAFFLKNFLISGCLIFPIEKTCIQNVFWFDAGNENGSIARVTMIENEAWTKGWSDQKDNLKNYEAYLSDFSWIAIWLDNHGKRTLSKLSPFLIFIIILSFVILKFVQKSDVKNKISYKNLDKKLLYIFLILNFFGSILWFLKFPVFRYGYSYIIMFIIFSTLIILYKKLQVVNLTNLKKKFSFVIIGLMFVLISKNTIRIIKNFDQDYVHAPWPRIYSYEQDNHSQKYEKILKNGEFLFYLSRSGLCMYGPAPCTHHSNNKIKLRRFNSYKVYYIFN